MDVQHHYGHSPIAVTYVTAVQRRHVSLDQDIGTDRLVVTAVQACSVCSQLKTRVLTVIRGQRSRYVLHTLSYGHELQPYSSSPFGPHWLSGAVTTHRVLADGSVAEKEPRELLREADRVELRKTPGAATKTGQRPNSPERDTTELSRTGHTSDRMT